jgi:hypothetical protein
MLEFHDALCAATGPSMRLRSACRSLVGSVSVAAFFGVDRRLWQAHRRERTAWRWHNLFRVIWIDG